MAPAADVTDYVKCVKDFAAKTKEERTADNAMAVIKSDSFKQPLKEDDTIDEDVIKESIKTHPNMYFDLKTVVTAAGEKTESADDKDFKNAKAILDATGASSRFLGCGPELDSFMGFRLTCGLFD